MFNEKNRLRFFLWVNDWKQVDLAEKAGISQATLSNAIARNKATAETRAAIAEALGVEEREIFPYGSR